MDLGETEFATPSMSKDSVPSSPIDSAVFSFVNTNGNTPIPIKLDRCILSKLSAITALTPNNIGPFAAQSLELPVPYSLPASTIKGTSSSRYLSAASYILMLSPLGI